MAAADRIRRLIGLGVPKHLARELVPGTALTNPAAITSTLDAPAGGTGATAGAYDTAAHRNEAIAVINATRADVVALRNKVDALMTELKSQGIIS